MGKHCKKPVTWAVLGTQASNKYLLSLFVFPIITQELLGRFISHLYDKITIQHASFVTLAQGQGFRKCKKTLVSLKIDLAKSLQNLIKIDKKS